MAANTGENEQALRKIIDFIRLLSIVILLFHFYFFLHGALQNSGLTSEFIDTIMNAPRNTGLFQNPYQTKFWVLGLLVISLIGAKGKKDEKINIRTAVLFILCGMLIFLLSHFILLLRVGSNVAAAKMQ